YRRAQHRFIGAGGSGKHGDPSVIPAKNFTLSIMYVPPGQGNAAHTHEVEECFFVLEGFLDVFVEDESGKRVTTRLGPWECISCPAGVIHGYQNDSLEPVYFQVMLGRGRPATGRYAADALYRRRGARRRAVWGWPPPSAPLAVPNLRRVTTRPRGARSGGRNANPGRRPERAGPPPNGPPPAMPTVF